MRLAASLAVVLAWGCGDYGASSPDARADAPRDGALTDVAPPVDFAVPVDAMADAPVDAMVTIDAAPPTPLAVVEDSIVVTRPDTSMLSFDGAMYYAQCGPFDGTIAPHPSVILARYVPATQAKWLLKVVISDVTIGTPLMFPNSFHYTMPTGAELVVNDEPNEAASSQPESSGSVTFQALDCNGTIELTVDATLGSELSEGPSVRVQGSLRAMGGS
ncbi:MAG: hypothetical protein SFX73_21900 [Kofleriaceae bacterium]|nr:hypothetical protein [Kofleriaceae bacterium]